ncbi:MAG: propionate catabolism operon regulatory protein PrpR, partial [Burkholderiales bacterium]|nr:propionate catabolism operon regulatory protein PrpR [Burkholderiales bacterium]
LQALTPGFIRRIVPELQIKTVQAEENFPPNNKESLQQVMEKFNGNRDAAAAHLGISRTTLWRRLKSG